MNYDESVAAIIAYARAQLGCPYTWGGEGPCSVGYDCSGLTMLANRQAGIAIAHFTGDQIQSCQILSGQSEALPGDLVFFYWTDPNLSPSTPSHVGLYVGGNQMINAVTEGVPIRQEAIVGTWLQHKPTYARPHELEARRQDSGTGEGGEGGGEGEPPVWEGGAYYVNSGGLRVRAEPSTSAAILAELPIYQPVIANGETADADGYHWLHIVTWLFGGDTVIGWSASEFLTKGCSGPGRRGFPGGKG